MTIHWKAVEQYFTVVLFVLINYTTTSKSNIGNRPIFLNLDRCPAFFNLDSLGLGVAI